MEQIDQDVDNFVEFDNFTEFDNFVEADTVGEEFFTKLLRILCEL